MNVFSVIQEWSSRPFEYGTSDCCQFVGAVVEAMTGHNPMAPFRYQNKAEALAIIRKFGDLETAFRATLGCPVEDGVILLAEMADGSKMAGVAYKGFCVVKSKDGVRDWPLTNARLTWAV